MDSDDERMDAEGERYAFTRSAHGFVCEALDLIDLYSEDLPLKVGYALLEYSVVKYFRPFKASNTKHAFSQPDGSEQTPRIHGVTRAG